MHSDGTSYQFQTQNGLCFPPPGMGSRWCRKRKVPWRIAVEVELCLGRSPDPDSALTNAGDTTRDTEHCRTPLRFRAFVARKGRAEPVASWNLRPPPCEAPELWPPPELRAPPPLL